VDESELTPEEKMAFESLPREAEPSEILEERVVRSLREEGLLGGGRKIPAGDPISHRPGPPSRAGGRGIWIRPWMLAGSIAASLVLFASGVVLGQWMGVESTSQAFMAVREQDATQLALRIQEAGSAYVSALAALGELQAAGSGSERSEEVNPRGGSEFQQGREVAVGALYGAAYELARLNPDDADVLRVLRILEERRAREEGRLGDERNMVWF